MSQNSWILSVVESAVLGGVYLSGRTNSEMYNNNYQNQSWIMEGAANFSILFTLWWHTNWTFRQQWTLTCSSKSHKSFVRKLEEIAAETLLLKLELKEKQSFWD